MGSSDANLESAILLLPYPNQRSDTAKPFEVLSVCAMLADFKPTSCFAKYGGQFREAMKHEPVGDEHQSAVGPVLPRQLNVLDNCGVQ